MKNNLNDIDLIIKQKLTNTSFPVPEKEWDMLSKHMSVKNFLRFNAGQVNVFYVGAVTILLGISGIFYAQNMQLKKSNREMKQLIEANYFKKTAAESETNEAIIENSSEIKEVIPAGTNKKNYHYNVVPVKKNSEVTNYNSESNVDTVEVNELPVIKSIDSIAKEPVTKKVVKRKVFIKNNPVVLKDTIIKRKNEK